MWRWVLAGAAGLALGTWSAWALAGGQLGDGGSTIRIGQWSANTLVGSKAADPWTRAATARVGLLALPRSETVYFDRTRDEAGQPIDPNCTYRLAGAELPARWWSVTLYDDDQMLARNADDAHAIDASSVAVGPDRRWEAVVGPAADGAASWISTGATRAPLLMVRLYQPAAPDDASLAALPLPTLNRVSCAVEAAR
jgi:hypothetical protein